MNTFYSTQLEWIHTLQSIRNPIFDHFFKFLDFFDRQEFLFIVIPIAWVGYHWKSGLRLFYIIILSAFVNYSIKQVFAEPRPFHMDPSVAVIQVLGYGFPSGAAQTSILLSGILLNHLHNKWGWIIAINYVFWVSLSRVYLGVHFPTDVLGGWTVGLLLWALYTYLRPAIETRLSSLRPTTLLIINIAIPLIIAYLAQSKFILRFCISMLAIGIGAFFTDHYRLFLPHPKNYKEFSLRAILGVAGAFIVYAIAQKVPTSNAYLHLMLVSFLPGLWVSLGAMLVLKLFWQRKRPQA